MLSSHLLLDSKVSKSSENISFTEAAELGRFAIIFVAWLDMCPDVIVAMVFEIQSHNYNVRTFNRVSR